MIPVKHGYHPYILLYAFTFYPFQVLAFIEFP